MRTESQDAMSFTTDRDLAIEVATLREMLVTRDGGSNYFDVRTAVGRGQDVAIFTEPPQPGNALLIGHAERWPARPLPCASSAASRASASTRATRHCLGGLEQRGGAWLPGRRVRHHRWPQP